MMPIPRVDVHRAREVAKGGSYGIQRGRATSTLWWFLSLALTVARTANHWLVGRAGNFRVGGIARRFF